MCDIATGVSAALAIHEALWRREQTGRGEGVRLSLFDVMAEWMTVPLLHHDYLGKAPANVGMAHPTVAPYGAFVSARRTDVVHLDSERPRVAQFCEPGVSVTMRLARMRDLRRTAIAC